MLNKIDHVGIGVYDLDAFIEKYEKLFNIKPRRVVTAKEMFTRIAFFKLGESMLEILSPITEGKGPIGEFLRNNGEGLHHIGYRVDNLKSLWEKMKKDNVKLMYKEPMLIDDGALIAFIEPEETGNVLTELVQREKELLE